MTQSQSENLIMTNRKGSKLGLFLYFFILEMHRLQLNEMRNRYLLVSRTNPVKIHQASQGNVCSCFLFIMKTWLWKTPSGVHWWYPCHRSHPKKCTLQNRKTDTNIYIVPLVSIVLFYYIYNAVSTNEYRTIPLAAVKNFFSIVKKCLIIIMRST